MKAGHPSTHPDPGHDDALSGGGLHESPRFAWTTLAVLFLAGGVIGSISLLLPHPRAFDDTALWSNIAVTTAASVACALLARRMPLWPLHLVLFAGTLVITRAIYYSGESSFYTFFYVWVGLYAFFFFGRRWGVAHMLAVAGTYAWVLTQVSASSALARWMMAMATLAVGGGLIAALVERLRGMGARFASIADERAELLVKLERVARTDDLTGLPNRRAWNEAIEREVARAEREETPLCVAVLDLDRFKQYNDVYGHQAGDRLLRTLAAAWRQQLRATDVLARYGGEEFTLALPGCDIDDAGLLMERLRAVVFADQTCSAGIAEWDRSESPAELVGRADIALYEAKATGRDRIVVA